MDPAVQSTRLMEATQFRWASCPALPGHLCPEKSEPYQGREFQPPSLMSQTGLFPSLRNGRWLPLLQ